MVQLGLGFEAVLLYNRDNTETWSILKIFGIIVIRVVLYSHSAFTGATEDLQSLVNGLGNLLS